MIGPSPGRSWAEFIERDRERWRRRALDAEEMLRIIRDMPEVQRNPDGVDQAAASMKLVAEGGCLDCPEPLECPDCGGECGPCHDSWECVTCGTVW
jgi:hypothetical protein